MQTTGLENRALIVTLNISQWTAKKVDRAVTKEVNRSHSASSDAGLYHKQLIDSGFNADITTIAGKARTYNYRKTLNWSDGARLLPSKMYMDYIKEMNELKAQFETEVDKKLKEYINYIDQSKQRLGSMYKSDDYPTVEEVRDKYSFEVTTMPIPTNDFRVQLPDDVLDKIKEGAGNEIQKRMTEAVKETWSRIADVLKNMQDKLSKDKTRIHDSLFENMYQLRDMLPELNLTDDPKINAICEAMKSIKAKPESVRCSELEKSKVLTQVDDILGKFGL